MNLPTPKRDLYLLAEKMAAEEIHPEVIEKLDRLAEVLLPPRFEAVGNGHGGPDS